MPRETINVEVEEIDSSRPGNIVVFVKTENGDVTGISSLVSECGLRSGDKVVAVLDSEEERIPLPGGGFLPPAPTGIWGNPCNVCISNPYTASASKQCTAARYLPKK
jgi:hypothetical protein